MRFRSDDAAISGNLDASLVMTENTAGPADAAEAHASALEAEITRLPETARFANAGALQVYCAAADEIPLVLDEIGRLREVTYRAVGEGTGNATDRDRFDTHYLHLFVWNRARRELVGAYRMGRTDVIVASEGVEGLYTRTLFRYDRHLVERLSPALELGRSFVRAEYQRHPTALMLLWKGICTFITRYPQYRVLFGAVSISTRYSDATRDLLMAFLAQNYQDGELASLVASTHPARPAAPRPAGSGPRTVEDAEEQVRALEEGDRGMPVLLRQYLKLNARLLGFNVDPAFGDALDALMMVDLTAVDPRILRRYFGAAEAQAFLDVHAALSEHHAA
jgi:putative hemolysin